MGSLAVSGDGKQKNQTAGLLSVRLNAIRYAARDTNLYELVRTDGGPLPAAEPGAHIDLHFPNGLARQYSLTEPAVSPSNYVIGIKLDPNSRGGSKFAFDNLRVGQFVAISAPRNHFPLDGSASHTVLVAGGIGITPIWSMVQFLARTGKSFELHYAARSKDDAAFLSGLQGFTQVNFHFDDEAAGRVLNLRQIVCRAPLGSQFYCCGPLPMIQAFEEVTHGIARDQVHIEHFGAKELPNLEGGFVVRLAKSGREFVVPSGKTILEVVREAGLEVPFSCEQGICGACETEVVAGIPDHRDAVLSNSEREANRTIMICCSGSKGDRIVLDL